MALRPHAVTRIWGPTAAVIIVAVVLAACLGIALRAEPGSGFGRGDWSAIRFTVWQALLSAAISVVVAIPLARALARRTFFGRGFLVMILGVPFILPVIVAVIGLLAVFGRNGWLNAVLGALGLPEVTIYGIHGVVLAHVFFNLPLATRLLLQGWQAVPAERFRLAAQLGLTSRAVFRTIEAPLLRQILPGAFMLIFVICLTSFAVALTLGGGPRSTTIELAIYQAFRYEFDLARAAMLSCVQLVLAGGAAVLALSILPQVTLGGGLDRRVERWDARQGLQRVGDAAIILASATFLFLPLVAVVGRGLIGLTQMPPSVWQAAITTLQVAALSVVLLLALVLPLAGWIASRRAGGVEAIGLLGLSFSPLMLGTGWFILLYPVVDPVALSLPVTALVNALMALPFALRIIVPQMRDSLAAFGRLGASLSLQGWPLWRWVILPRLWPQIGFAAGLTGALSVGDLGVIALFADPERVTLPLEMYRLMGAYRMEAAAGAALMLLVLALGVFWICDKGGRWRAQV